MKSIVLLFGLITLFGSCATDSIVEQENTVQLNDTIQNKNIAYSGFNNSFKQVPESFSIDAQKDVVIKTKNGSRIHISKNSFVDANGQKIKGKINFDVMEFNTIGEIIASNIPMVYLNPDGEKEQFESAGMFSLAANQNGIEIRLDQGKKIKVEYATDVDGAFNFYQLKEDSSNWELKESNLLPTNNPYLEKAKEKLNNERSTQPELPKKPLTLSDEDALFDLMAFETAHNFNQEFNGLMWKYIGNDPELNPAKEPAKFRNIHKFRGFTPYDTTFLAFTMDFQNTSTNKGVMLNAAPIYRGKMLDRNEKKHKETIEKIEQSAKLQDLLIREIENEKELLRMFEVESLGIFNYDVKNFDANNIDFVANFTFEGATIDNVNIYLIPNEYRIVVKYTPSTFQSFSINPNNTNKIVAILPNKDVYVIGNRDIKKMNLKNQPIGSQITFDLKKVNKAIETPADLDQAIGVIV